MNDPKSLSPLDLDTPDTTDLGEKGGVPVIAVALFVLLSAATMLAQDSHRLEGGRLPGNAVFERSFFLVMYPLKGCDGVGTSDVTGIKAFAVSGCFDGLDRSKGPVTVSISPVSATASSRTQVGQVGETGTFHFSNVPSGSYVMTATQERRLIALHTLTVPLERPLLIGLTFHGSIKTNSTDPQ